MANPRDVNINIDAHDQTGPGTRAAARNIDRLQRKLGETTGVARKVAGGIASALGTVAGTASKAAGPAGIAIAAGIGVTLAPQLTMVASGAIIAGGVLGVARLAAYLQKDNPALKQAKKNLKKTVMDGLKGASKPLADDFVKAVNRIESSANRSMPLVGKAFKAVEPFIVPLTDAMIEFAENAAPGFVRMLQKADPVIKSLAATLPLVGIALGDLFDQIGDGAPQAARATGDLVLVFAVLVASLAATIRITAKYYDQSRTAFFGILRVAASAFAGTAGVIGRFVSGTLRQLASLAEATGQDRLAAKLRGMAASVDKTTNSVVQDIRSIQAAIDRMHGKDVWVNVKVSGLGGLNKAKQIARDLPAGGGFSAVTGFATAGRESGMARTGGAAPVVNASTTVVLDGAVIRAQARTIVSHESARQAWRARTGRR